MPTDAIVGWSAGALGLAVVLFKLIHEIFRARKPHVTTDYAGHFKALFARVGELKKVGDLLTAYMTERKMQIAVEHEQRKAFGDSLKRMEQDIESLRRKNS